jgi:hypothetical protein
MMRITKANVGFFQKSEEQMWRAFAARLSRNEDAISSGGRDDEADYF